MSRTNQSAKYTVRGGASKTSGEEEVRNQILLDLPDKGRAFLLAKMHFEELPKHMLLNEMGDAIRFAYFLNTGLASLLNVMADGKSVEVGLTGSEGFVGLPLVAGLATSHARVVSKWRETDSESALLPYKMRCGAIRP